MKTEQKAEIELQSHFAVVELPDNTVEFELRCKVYENGKLIKVSRMFDIAAVREAFRKAEDGYIDDDDRFVLTDKGEQFLDEMRNAYGDTPSGN